MNRLGLLLLAAAFASSAWEPCSATQASRLREVDLDMQALGHSQEFPVNRKGSSGPTRVAGYYALNRTNAGELFYYFFESKNDPANDPVVVWMNGGPGCSSQMAVFYENGPFRINDDLTLRDNPDSWDATHNMIFVDQPIGVGFSYTDDPADNVYRQAGVGEDMLDFIRAFMDAHPDLADNPFYVSGESYGGHYTPTVAHRVWRYNKEATGAPINLQGFSIGNGWTDPITQYNAYADYALQNDLISRTVYNSALDAGTLCTEKIKHCHSTNSDAACKAAQTFCFSSIFKFIMANTGGVNHYDISKPCSPLDKVLCYDFSAVGRYLAQDKVKKALGVGHREFKLLSPEVHENMLGDMVYSTAHLLPDMLDDGIRGLLYAGILDLKDNWLGNRRWVNAMPWSQSEEWAAKDECIWEVDAVPAASVTEVGPLAFVKLFGAGHQVPMDKGDTSLTMIEHLTRDKRFKCNGIVTDIRAPVESDEGAPLSRDRESEAVGLSRDSLTGDGSV